MTRRAWLKVCSSQLAMCVLQKCIGKDRSAALVIWRLKLLKGKDDYTSFTFTNLQLICIVSSTLLSVYQISTKNWIASNGMALAAAFHDIKFRKLDSFVTGILLLAGLLIYDVYWVFYSARLFGQSVMVRNL